MKSLVLKNDSVFAGLPLKNDRATSNYPLKNDNIHANMIIGGMIMLSRDIWEELIEWKNRKHRPLIIKGLRQTGKTFIVREFGKQFYKNTVYVDLRANKTVHAAFEGDFSVDGMVMSISAAIPTARFLPGETLIIFDEIQKFPKASYLKQN